jgi:hypothetical protein
VNPLPPPPQPIFLRAISIPFSHTFLFFQACYMSLPHHSPWFHLSNDIWGWVQVMKLPSVQLPSFSSSFIPLRSKYSLQHPVLKRLQSVFSLNVRVQVSFLDSRREGRNLWIERKQAFTEFSLLQSLRARNSDLLVLFQGIWTLLHLHRTCSLFLCYVSSRILITRF